MSSQTNGIAVDHNHILFLVITTHNFSAVKIFNVLTTYVHSNLVSHWSAQGLLYYNNSCWKLMYV